jgi:hypothetical protein
VVWGEWVQHNNYKPVRPHTNFLNVKDKYADWPAKTRATPNRNDVLPLLNRRGSKQIVL